MSNNISKVEVFKLLECVEKVIEKKGEKSTVATSAIGFWLLLDAIEQQRLISARLYVALVAALGMVAWLTFFK